MNKLSEANIPEQKQQEATEAIILARILLVSAIFGKTLLSFVGTLVGGMPMPLPLQQQRRSAACS